MKYFILVAALLLAAAIFAWQSYQDSEKLQAVAAQQRIAGERRAEADRQVRVALKVFHAVDRFVSSPNFLTHHEAEIAVDSLSEEHLSSDKVSLLGRYYYVAKDCMLLDGDSDDPDQRSEVMPISLPAQADKAFRSEATLGL